MQTKTIMSLSLGSAAIRMDQDAHIWASRGLSVIPTHLPSREQKLIRSETKTSMEPANVLNIKFKQTFL